MPGLDNPKDKKIAEALAERAEVPHGKGAPAPKGEPLSWNLREDGSMTIVLVQGPKYTYSAEEVAEAMKAPKAPPPPKDSSGLASKTVPELKELAAGAGIEGYSDMKKGELIEALETAEK